MQVTQLNLVTREQLSDMLKDGMSLQVIANQMGCTRQAVHKRLTRLGLLTEHKIGVVEKNQKKYMTNLQALIDKTQRLNKTLEQARVEMGWSPTYTQRMISTIPQPVRDYLEELRRSLVGNNVKIVRSFREMSQPELARKSKLFNETIVLIESGQKLIRNKRLEKIARVLDVPVELFFRPITYTDLRTMGIFKHERIRSE